MASEARSEPRRPPSARLFVALDLPADARERVVAWQHDVLGGHGRSVRLVRPESLHVTLAFLGHHPPDEVDAIGAAAFSGLGELPAAERSRTSARSPGSRTSRAIAVPSASLTDQHT